MIAYNSILFGQASAQEESANNPNLLIKGFFDSFGVIREIRTSTKFLVLGYKGSGKTAIAEHLRLISETTDDLSVQVVYLEDFPYTSFKKIVTGEDEPETKYPTGWSLIIYLLTLTSLAKTGSLQLSEYEEIYSKLTQHRLLPLESSNLKRAVLNLSQYKYKTQLLKELSEIKDYANQTLDLLISVLVDDIKNIVSMQKVSKQHLLIFDGLDDVLTKRNTQFEAIAGLVYAVNRINQAFRQIGVNCKVIILCRTDLFERLPGGNKNKIRQDASINLDWYADPRDPKASALLDLVRCRAKLSDPSIEDIFDEFFPQKIENEKNTVQFILDMTRHIPRDMIKIMTMIQKYSDGVKPTRTQIMSGIRDYSINYFVQEIMDELAGYLEGEQIENLFKIISTINKRVFLFTDVVKVAGSTSNFTTNELINALEFLYNCSAIGNASVAPDGTNFYSFKFRNRNSNFDLKKSIVLHRGMWKAFNLV